MAIRLEERTEVSRAYNATKDGTTFTIAYNVIGTKDPFAAAGKLPRVGTILKIDGKVRNIFVDDVSVEPFADIKINNEPVLRATVSYGKPTFEKNTPPDPKANLATWKLSGTAQSVHIETVLPDTEQEFIPADSSFKGNAIGYTADGIQGVDVLRPHSLLTIQHWLPVSTATADFIDKITALGGSVNKNLFAGPWGNWKPGEALYHGPEVTSPNDELISFVHIFERSLEVKKIKIKLPASKKDGEFKKKRGWDYFWTRVGDGKDKANEKKMLKGIILSAHIGRVYEEESLGPLKLPKDFIGGQ